MKLRAIYWFLLGGVLLSAIARLWGAVNDVRLEVLDAEAVLSPEGKEWTAPIHIWVYEPETRSPRRRAFLAALRRAMQDDASENPYYRERSWRFVVDNERGRKVKVVVADREFVLGPSRADGWIHATLTLPRAAGQPGEALPLRVEGVDRVMSTTATLRLAGAGPLVISDIDDTVKISSVTDREALLRNTFFEPWRAVPGMAERFQEWAKAGASFHYVSASPAPLETPLRDFLAQARFPPGTLHLKPFRWRRTELRGLLSTPASYKEPILEALLAENPRRPVILVGDTGESDPAIYADFARRHPGRVSRIVLRTAGGSSGGKPCPQTSAGVTHWEVLP